MTERGETIPHNALIENRNLSGSPISCFNNIKSDTKQEESCTTNSENQIKDIILLDLCSNHDISSAASQTVNSLNKPKKKKKNSHPKIPSRSDSERFFYYMTRDMIKDRKSIKPIQPPFNQATHNNYMTNNCIAQASQLNLLSQHLKINNNSNIATSPNDFYNSKHNINYSYSKNCFGERLSSFISSWPLFQDLAYFTVQEQPQSFKYENN